MNDHPPADDPGCFKFVGILCVAVSFVGLLCFGLLGGMALHG